MRRLIKQGAKGVVLDLRDNGGGLLNEAVLVSSIFIPEGPIVSTKGRTRPERTYEATGGAISPKIPVSCWSTASRRRRRRSWRARCRTATAAKVIGTRTFGKGVFQEVKQLSNGGALDITVGEYFTPDGRNLGGGGVKEGKGVQPDVAASDDERRPPVATRRSSRRSTRSRARPPARERAARAGRRRPGGLPAGEARALPRGDPVLHPRRAHEPRQAAAPARGAARRPRARRADRAARRPRRACCGGSAARTSRATSSRR